MEQSRAQETSIIYSLILSLTHSFIYSLIHLFPYSAQKHVLLANNFSHLNLPLSRVAFAGGWGVGWEWGYDSRILGTHPQLGRDELGELEALHRRREDSRRLDILSGRCCRTSEDSYSGGYRLSQVDSSLSAMPTQCLPAAQSLLLQFILPGEPLPIHMLKSPLPGEASPDVFQISPYSSSWRATPCCKQTPRA